MRVSCFSCIWLFGILWTVAHRAPLSIGFSRQDYWGGLPCPPPGDLSHPGIELASFMSPALAGRFFTTSAIWEALTTIREGKKIWAEVSILLLHLRIHELNFGGVSRDYSLGYLFSLILSPLAACQIPLNFNIFSTWQNETVNENSEFIQWSYWVQCNHYIQTGLWNLNYA